MNNLKLFLQLPIGALFFRDPFDGQENPSVKVDDDHARKPNGEVVKVNGGVLVFTSSKPQDSEVFAIGEAQELLS